MTDMRVLTVAARLDRQMLRRYEAYLEECEQYRREGYRPHHCEHGTNLWTDYDNICGPCEDGMTNADGLQRRTYALESAHDRVKAVDDLVAAVLVLRENNIEVDGERFSARLASLLAVEGY